MAIFNCKICGGSLSINNNDKVAVCEYCGTAQTLPKLDDDKRIQLYDRANYFRRENEFDKAMGIYEMILSEDKEDYEAYWGIVLCRYGIQYVKDPKTSQRIPTVNRSQFTSIYDDEDFMNAIKYSDETQREIFKKEAYIIDKIQKRILEISSREEAFDVFICYKETDKNGNRTQDSVYAQDIYTALTKEGYNVFFSRITLEDKLGSAYEPYIFAALNSAKVMLVVGTEKDNFNAVWVKNEWSRFLSLVKAGKDKTLIPVYKDISPYDMPEEFAYLQSQDINKIGYLQDLVYGIKKLINKNKLVSIKENVVINNSNINITPLLKRAFMFLEDGKWNSANEYCEKVLDINPECAEAYLGKLMAQYNINKREDLRNTTKAFDKSINYQKAYKFADVNLRSELDYYVNNCDVDRTNHMFKKSTITLKLFSVISGILLAGSMFINLFYQIDVVFEQRYLLCCFEFISIALAVVAVMLKAKNPYRNGRISIPVLAQASVLVFPILTLLTPNINNSFMWILTEMFFYADVWILPQFILYPIGIIFIVISAILVEKSNKYGFAYFTYVFVILLHVLQIGCIIFDFMYPNKELFGRVGSMDMIIFIVYAVINILLYLCMMVFLSENKKMRNKK